VTEAEQFPFIDTAPTLAGAGLRPYFPITLTLRQKSVAQLGLLDTGAAVNVLPYEVGLQLGAVWTQQTVPVVLTGNLAQCEARGLLLSATAGNFPAVSLAFAWTTNNTVPLILGQVNFFQEFDVCFYRSRLTFSVKPK
jgi:hypothetical protein